MPLKKQHLWISSPCEFLILIWILDSNPICCFDRSTLTVANLRSLSDKLGIKIKSRAKKPDVIQELLDYANGTPIKSASICL